MEQQIFQHKTQKEDLVLSFKVPYSFQDTCLNEYLNYQQCMRQNPRMLENGLVHALPFSGIVSVCVKSKILFTKCQDYREREIFEEMRKIYVENVRVGNFSLTRKEKDVDDR